jgi:hypothetical protein
MWSDSATGTVRVEGWLAGRGQQAFPPADSIIGTGRFSVNYAAVDEEDVLSAKLKQSPGA